MSKISYYLTVDFVLSFFCQLLRKEYILNVRDLAGNVACLDCAFSSLSGLFVEIEEDISGIVCKYGYVSLPSQIVLIEFSKGIQ